MVRNFFIEQPECLHRSVYADITHDLSVSPLRCLVPEFPYPVFLFHIIFAYPVRGGLYVAHMFLKKFYILRIHEIHVRHVYDAAFAVELKLVLRSVVEAQYGFSSININLVPGHAAVDSVKWRCPMTVFFLDREKEGELPLHGIEVIARQECPAGIIRIPYPHEPVVP